MKKIRNILMVVMFVGFSLMGFIQYPERIQVQRSIPFDSTYSLNEYYSAAFGDVNWEDKELNKDSHLVMVSGSCLIDSIETNFKVQYTLSNNEYMLTGLYFNNEKQTPGIAFEFISGMKKLSKLEGGV